MEVKIVTKLSYNIFKSRASQCMMKRSVHDFKSVHRNVQELSMKITVDTLGQRTDFFWNCPKNVPELSVEHLDTFWTLNVVRKVSIK